MNDLLNWVGDHAWVGWVGAAVALTLVELLSLDLVLLMFAFGALAAAIAAAIGAPLWVCIAVFAAVSLVMLFIARPKMAARLHDGPSLTTGHQALVGHTAVVERNVDAYGGRVMLHGEAWTARAENSTDIFEPSTEVTVVRIDGATAVVTRKATL